MTRGPRRAFRSTSAGGWVTAVVIGLAVALPPAPAGGSTPNPGWTVYHGDAIGSGAAADISAVSVQTPAWTSPRLDGQLYGQPVTIGSEVMVATENDTVYALKSSDGAVVWSTHVGTPVSASSLPCGDISPSVGITGTPVIDTQRNEVFVVADVSSGTARSHHLVGLSASTGKVLLNQVVDPAGADPAALLQRTGLNLDSGRVVFGFGGNYGDCGSYHGWVLAVPEGGGTASTYEVDAAAGQSQGAIWMGGAAPAVDAAGNVWVSAGNGSVTSTGAAYDDSDSVLELSPTLSLLQFYAPTDWAADNRADRDLSVAPALLANGLVAVAGKARAAVLLQGSHLGGIGGQLATLPSVCDQDIDGGTAVVGTTVYLPCQSGPVAISVSSSPASLHVLWQAHVGGGPPVVAGGLVWTMSQSGTLYGLNPATGTVAAQATVGAPANHFPTPGVGPGLLLTAAGDDVVAFTATTTATSTTTSTTTTSAASSTTTTPHHSSTASTPASGGLAGWAIALLAAGGVVLAGVALTVARRRRSPSS